MEHSLNNTANQFELEEICSIVSHACAKCQSAFGTEEDLKVHHEKEHGKRKDPIVYNCGTCEEKYSDKPLLTLTAPNLPFIFTEIKSGTQIGEVLDPPLKIWIFFYS